MIKTHIIKVKRAFHYFILLFFIFELEASSGVDIEKLLPNIEIVSSFEDRKRGLMFKPSIPNDFGMFFIWEYKKKQCMWMKDTFIPLNVAYISDNGEIIDIYDMVPFSRKSVCSSIPVKYALEVNKDWFKKNNVSTGDILNIKTIISNDK